jgi:hypothetical protein
VTRLVRQHFAISRKKIPNFFLKTWAKFRLLGDCLLKNTEAAPNLVLFFHSLICLCINSDKNGSGYVLDDCFTNTPGHPVAPTDNPSHFKSLMVEAEWPSGIPPSSDWYWQLERAIINLWHDEVSILLKLSVVFFTSVIVVIFVSVVCFTNVVVKFRAITKQNSVPELAKSDLGKLARLCKVKNVSISWLRSGCAPTHF